MLVTYLVLNDQKRLLIQQHINSQKQIKMAQPSPWMSPYTLGSSSRHHHEEEIENLYHEFESLKSKIYGFQDNQPLRTSQRQQHSSIKDKSKQHLQQSTIRKCQYEFARQLQSIKKNECEHSSVKKRKQSKQPLQMELRRHEESKVKDFSKILSRNTGGLAINMDSLSKQYEQNEESLCVEDLSGQLQRNEALFHQLINESSKIKIKEKVNSIDFESVRGSLEAFSSTYLDMLSRVDSNIKFLNQKLRCLQLVFAEFAKVKKGIRQAKAKQVEIKGQFIANLQSIQNRYQHQIKSLTSFYERRSKQIELHYQEQFQKMKTVTQSRLENSSDSEKSSLKSLLQKAKNVISTKQELIVSLQDENDELRRQLQKVSIQKSDALLRYSATSHKLKEDMIQISAIRVKPKRSPQVRGAEDDDINFSELGSVKDGNLSEWDTSQLNLDESISFQKSQKGSSRDQRSGEQS